VIHVGGAGGLSDVAAFADAVSELLPLAHAGAFAEAEIGVLFGGVWV
jgi:hypothetical protein